MTYAESDLDRALLGQPSKKVEAALRAERRPKWQTEFDDELAPLKRMILVRGGIAAVCYIALQAVLIFFVFGKTDVRPQTANGVIALSVMGVGFFLSLFWMLMPTKRMGYESLKLIRESKQLGIEGAEKTERTFSRIEAKIGLGMETMNQRLKGIEAGIKDFNTADPPLSDKELAELEGSSR